LKNAHGKKDYSTNIFMKKLSWAIEYQSTTAKCSSNRRHPRQNASEPGAHTAIYNNRWRRSRE